MLYFALFLFFVDLFQEVAQNEFLLDGSDLLAVGKSYYHHNLILVSE